MMKNNTPHKRTSQNEHGIGPVVGTLIIVILLIVGALYIWSDHLNTEAQIQEQNQNLSTTTTIIIYSTSTEPTDIQKDLNASPVIQSPAF